MSARDTEASGKVVATSLSPGIRRQAQAGGAAMLPKEVMTPLVSLAGRVARSGQSIHHVCAELMRFHDAFLHSPTYGYRYGGGMGAGGGRLH